MKINEIKDIIRNGGIDGYLTRQYGDGAVDVQRKRYLAAVDSYENMYGGDGDISVFSVGGRSEISGNHTDHNNGRVVAAAVDLDIIAVASKRDDLTVNVSSEGFPQDTVDLSIYTEPRDDMFFTSASIIAGVADGLSRRGYSFGGFDAYTTSNVLGGSGLSSSAAFEVMIGNIQNHFYCDGKVTSPEIAMISQYAENKYFGKPCGLMDQTACAVGGFVAIDFADPTSPVISPVAFDLTGAGYSLCIVSTGGSHADLNDDYASIPAEMKAVAAHFGRPVLRGLEETDIIKAIPTLREKTGDRAILRALHFISEDKRAGLVAEVLRRGDLDSFLSLISRSGDSSYKYLQNVYTVKDPREEGLALALRISEDYLCEIGGACRVHGGGFAGTIQAFVPTNKVEDYRVLMDSAFGDGACRVLSVRPDGAVKVL
ncbi:MAG: galactokinase [Clostridia bacterium]|nr:galactokinase [Clostridia bacterium]